MGLHEPVDTANARLIAAAPEMYELLQQMLREYQRREWSDPVTGPAADARALLARIEGHE